MAKTNVAAPQTPIRVPCRAATTAAVADLSACPVLQDGVTLIAGDSLLVKNTASPDGVEPASAAYNGMYVVGLVTAGTAPLTRRADASVSEQFVPTMLVPVQEGTLNADKAWQLTTDLPIVLGTTALIWSQTTLVFGLVADIQNVGTLAAAGASGRAADAAHAHPHGAQTDGSLHAGASALANGFMSAADFTKLGGVETGADVTDETNVIAALNTSAAAKNFGGGAIGNVGNVDGRDVSADGTTLDAVPGTYVPQARTITTTSPLSGGGALSGNLTLTIPAATAGSAGHATAAQISKLDGIAPNATNTPLSSTLPEAVGTAAIGNGTTAARHNHVHAHGNQLGGSLHAAAVAGVSDGFITGANQTKLDGIETGADVTDLANVQTALGAAFRTAMSATATGVVETHVGSALLLASAAATFIAMLGAENPATAGSLRVRLSSDGTLVATIGGVAGGLAARTVVAATTAAWHDFFLFGDAAPTVAIVRGLQVSY